MAAISRRPRLALICGTRGCVDRGRLQPAQAGTETAEDKQEHAARSGADGKHAEAAQAYAELATQPAGDSDNYQLLSAEQWVAAGNIAAAKQAFAAGFGGRAHQACRRRARWSPPKLPTRKMIGARAIRELDQIPVPTAADQAQNYYWIRGRSAFLTGHPVEGTRALVERERWLSDPAALRANREELYETDSQRRRARRNR